MMLSNYRGYLALFVIGVWIFLAYFLAGDLFWLYFVIILIGLVSGRLIKHYRDSYVVDKLVIISAVGFAFPVIVVLVLLGLEVEYSVSSWYSDVLLGLQFAFFSLFLSLYFDELSKSDSDNYHDKLELKLAELDGEGVDEALVIMDEFHDVVKSDNYALLVNLPIRSYKKENRLVRAAEALRPNFIIMHSLVAGFNDFTNFHGFLKNIYFIWKGQMLTKEDYDRIYFGGLDERVIFGLDDFDLIEDVPIPTDDFFSLMKDLKWFDDAKMLCNRLEGVREYYFLNFFEVNNKFLFAEKGVLRFLMACSALSRNNNHVDQEDVLIAYKTYLKLIKTDLTRINPLGSVEEYKVN